MLIAWCAPAEHRIHAPRYCRQCHGGRLHGKYVVRSGRLQGHFNLSTVPPNQDITLRNTHSTIIHSHGRVFTWLKIVTCNQRLRLSHDLELPSLQMATYHIPVRDTQIRLKTKTTLCILPQQNRQVRQFARWSAHSCSRTERKTS